MTATNDLLNAINAMVGTTVTCSYMRKDGTKATGRFFVKESFFAKNGTLMVNTFRKGMVVWTAAKFLNAYNS
jgi:hypothetical protein